jgi:hypothetical protein
MSTSCATCSAGSAWPRVSWSTGCVAADAWQEYLAFPCRLRTSTPTTPRGKRRSPAASERATDMIQDVRVIL